MLRIWSEPGATLQFYPLTFTVFSLGHQIWGLSPVGYHIANVVLHALNVCLLWLILRKLDIPVLER